MATGLNIPIAGKVYAESVTFTPTTIPGASTANKYVLGYGGAYLMYWSGQPLSPMTVGAGETVGTWSSNGTFTSKGTIGTFSYYNHVVNENHSGNGSVSGTGTYTIDDGSTKTITVTATPDSGWVCTGLSYKPSFEPTTAAVSASIALSGAGPTTIYATFEKYCTISFNKNGHGTTPSSISPCLAGVSYSLPSMSATGYKFLGWAESSSATSGFYSYTIPATPANKTLYAVWITHTVHFNANGGSGSMSDQHFAPGVAQNLKANAFSRSGYNFGGWALTADGAAVYGDKASVTAAAAGETTLYAVWTQLSVTYTNTGDSTKAPTYGSANQTVTLATAPSWTGYTFTGWMIGTQLYSAGANYTFGTTSVTATAQWTAKTYKFVFKPNGGQLNGSTTVDVNIPNATNTAKPTFGKSYWYAIKGTINPVAPTGYHFTGVYTAATNGSQVWDANGAAVNGSYWDGSGSSATLKDVGADGATLTFYAQWARNTYTVTLNRQGGTSGATSVTATYGLAMPSTTMPTRTGYTFGGYYGREGGTGDLYYNADGSSAREWTILGPGIVYAKWTVHIWTVTFNANGGSGGWSRQMDYGTTITAPSVSRTGYEFASWDPAFESGTTVPDNDVTYTAQWTAHKYYINFDLNYAGGSRAALYKSYGTAVEITPPTRENYVFAGWTVTGVDSSVAKYGTTSNPSTRLNNGATVGSASGSIWVKNLTTQHQATNGGDITFKANWQRISYTINATQSSSLCNINIDGDANTLDDSELAQGHLALSAKASGQDTYSDSFTAYAGGGYTITLTMLAASRRYNSWYHPVKYGNKNLVRQAGSVNAPAVFTAYYVFGANENSPQSWGSGFRRVMVTIGDNPLAETEKTLRPTMSLASGEAGNTNVKVIAGETTMSEFLSWEYDTEAVTPVSVSGNTIIVPTASNVSLVVNYKRRLLAVSAAVDAATTAAMNLVVDPPTLSATVTMDGDPVDNVGYGLSATWTFSISNPPEGFSDNYEFAGWFKTATPSDPNERPEYTDRVVTIEVTAPTTLYARMRAKVKFIVDNGSEEGTKGGIAVNSEAMLPVLPAEVFYTIGSTISIKAIPRNDDSHFNGWFLGGTSHADSTRIPGYAAEAQFQVGNAAVLLAYFAASAEIFYVALYQRNAATRSYNDFVDPFGTLALVTAEGEVDELTDDELTSEEVYRKLACAPPVGAKGVYYQVVGIRRVDATLTQTTGQTTGVKRVIRGEPGQGEVLNELQIAERMPFSAVIDADCSFVVDFGDVSHRELVADVVSQSGQKVGGVAKVLDAEEITNRTDASETGRYEIGRPAVAYAIPDNGYKFDGWFSSSAGTGTALSTDVKYEFDMPAFPSGSTTPHRVYAKFSLGSFALYKWEGSERRKQLSWKSKVYELSKPANLTSVRVDATTLNASQLAYPLARFRYESFSSPNAQAPSSGVVDFAVGDKDRRLQSQDMRRLPYVTPEGRHIRPERYFQVQVEDAAEVDAIIIGTSGEGLAT